MGQDGADPLVCKIEQFQMRLFAIPHHSCDRLARSAGASKDIVKKAVLGKIGEPFVTEKGQDPPGKERL